MKSTNFLLCLAAHATLSSALQQHQMRRRQDDDSSVDPVVDYIFKMCSPDTYYHSYNNNYSETTETFTLLSHSSAPCDQRDFILGSCIANSTVPEVDFAAEQQCFCGSNIWEAWVGCEACFRAHGYPFADYSEEDGKSWVSSISSAECAPSPFPSVPFRNLFTIITASTKRPSITLTNDMFPNQTAASNYWTKNASPTPVLGSITGIATGRATSRTGLWEPYTPSGSMSSSSGTAMVTSNPTASGSGSASGSAAGVSTTASTAGVGDLAVGGGIVLVVVNVFAVMLL